MEWEALCIISVGLLTVWLDHFFIDAPYIWVFDFYINNAVNFVTLSSQNEWHLH
jgi:hypothetical protein